MSKVIDGVLQKELYCKNDACMYQFGYFRLYRGIITIYCRKCQTKNVWRVRYGILEEKLDRIIDMAEDGE
jgi:hypothetical protein